MSEEIGWRFPPLGAPGREGFSNNDSEAQKGEDLIDHLVREMCQNSLDARRADSEGPVKVVFELSRIPTQLKAFTEYKHCVAQCWKCWEQGMDEHLQIFLEGADAILSDDELLVLAIKDYNTEGLRGSREEGNSNEGNSTPQPLTSWEAATSEGISCKSSETSGGSFGIGKNAAFACSSLGVVFYNTFADDGEKAFVGLSKMASIFDDDGKTTRRIGRYQRNYAEGSACWKPIFLEDEDELRDMFYRNEYGTDVIIAAFVQEEGWMDDVAKAVLKNFFVAIYENHLVVQLKSRTGSHSAERDIVIDKETTPQLIEKYKDEIPLTAQAYVAYTDPAEHVFEKILKDSDEDNEIELFIKADNSFDKSVSNFRDNGMLIFVKRRKIVQNYAAVLIVRGEELNELLRATEPPPHDEWDHKRIQVISDTTRDKKERARKAIDRIDKIVLKRLKQQVEVNSDLEVDAAGIGEYLPDGETGGGSSSKGDDPLRPKIKVGVTPVKKKKRPTEVVAAQKGKGVPQTGVVHNSTKNPEAPSHEVPTQVVEPGNDSAGIEGVSQGAGTKQITRLPTFPHRTYPLNDSEGLYKIMLVPSETYEELYVACSARGEDGRTEALDIEKVKCDGASVKATRNVIGPLRVKANTLSSLFVTFKRKEKMVIDLDATEGAEA